MKRAKAFLVYFACHPLRGLESLELLNLGLTPQALRFHLLRRFVEQLITAREVIQFQSWSTFVPKLIQDMTAEQLAEQVKAELRDAWLPSLYRDRVLQMRTRTYHFGPLPKRPVCVIQHTLLGVELKVGRRRLVCPDLATARYLSVFARSGCADIAVPYDITKTSQLADELESAWQRMLLLADRNAASESDRFRTRLHGLLVAKLRAEVAAAGAGREVPEFKQNTRQRAI